MPVVDIDGTDENADWIKTLESRRSEKQVHDSLKEAVAGGEKKRAWFNRWGSTTKGGPGSGNRGHKGRLGIRGGAMPSGLSTPPQALAGQPDLAGESTNALFRTLDGFEQDKNKEGIKNIRQELVYRSKLQSAITHLKRGREKVGPEKIDRTLSTLEDMLDRREGIERIPIPSSMDTRPSSYEIAHNGTLALYTRPTGYRGTGAIMQGKDGKTYAYKRNNVFEVRADETNTRGQIPRYER